MSLWLIIVIAVGGYLFGNVSFARILAKFFKKRDITREGSGNPGAMNMARNFGTGFGLLTLALDGLKGVVAALLGWLLSGDGQMFKLGSIEYGAFIGGASAVLGHIFPVFFRFKGGKGISTTVGFCFVINPLVTLISLSLGFVFIGITKMGAVTSFVVITVPLALKARDAADFPSPYGTIMPLILLGVFLLTFWAHRKNIYKLFSGRESKTPLVSKGQIKS